MSRVLVPASLSHIRCQLGEGLHWSKLNSVLYWVDIHGMKIYAWNLFDEPDCFQLDQRVGWVIYSEKSDSLYLGLQSGVAIAPTWNPSAYRLIHPMFSDRPHLRLNDAKLDELGRIWTGSLNNDDETRPEGSLFCIRPGKSVSVIDTGYMVTNGPAIDPSAKWLYHTDSLLRTIYRFAMHPYLDELTARVEWKVFKEHEGFPDGMTFDDEGRLWVAHWGGGCVSCLDVDGNLLKKVELPTPYITNLCFVDKRLFVTTAVDRNEPTDSLSLCFSGRVFEIEDWAHFD